jgi:hypothetical protein
MKNKLLFLGTLLFVTGCSVMPYNDDFSCQGGKNTKICASVSDVYLMDDEQLNNRNKHLLSKKEKDIIKILKKENNALMYKQRIITYENQDLKRVIENVEMSKLEKPIIIILKKDNRTDINDSGSIKKTLYKVSNFISEDYINNKVKKINKPIKVCVLNANIRKKPSCKSKVVKVLHKGDSIFALYEKNGWIKLKNGSFIHKSITDVNCQNGSLK